MISSYLPFRVFEAPIWGTDLKRTCNGGGTDLLWKRFLADFCSKCKFKKLFSHIQIF